MVSTNDKKVRMAVQAHIRNQYKGMGGIKAMVDDIDTIRLHYNKTLGVTEACRLAVSEKGLLLVYYDDVIRFLHKIGFTDDARIRNYRPYGGGAFGLYTLITSREVEALYNDYKRKHAKR